MTTPDSLTGKLRVCYAVLFVVVVLTGLVGWVAFDRDPMQLAGLLGAVTVAAGIGEASNVGKRATFKKEAVE